MTKINGFGFFNVNFNSKAVDKDGNRRITSFNNLRIPANRKSVYASAENGVGKTSIFRLLQTLFLPINQASKDIGSNQLNNYFKHTGSSPAIIWMDLTKNYYHNLHTLIVEFVQLKPDINISELNHLKPSETLKRHGLVINYDTSDKILNVNNSNFGIINYLGLVNKADSGSYVPINIKDINSQLNKSMNKIANRNMDINIIFNKSLNYSDNIKDYKIAIEDNAYARTQINIWENFYSKILHTEGGIVNVFGNIEKNGTRTIKEPSVIAKELMFPAIVSHNNLNESVNSIKTIFQDMFKTRLNNDKNYQDYDNYLLTSKSFEEFNEEKYQNLLLNYGLKKHQQYFDETKIILAKDELEKRLAQNRVKQQTQEDLRLQTKFEILALDKDETVKNHGELLQDIKRIATDAVINLTGKLNLDIQKNRQECIDTEAKLKNLEIEKDNIINKQTNIDRQNEIKLIQARLYKYFSLKKAANIEKSKKQNEYEAEIKRQIIDLNKNLKTIRQQKEKTSTELEILRNDIRRLKENTKERSKEELTLEKEKLLVKKNKLVNDCNSIETSLNDLINSFNKSELRKKEDQEKKLFEENLKLEQKYSELSQSRKTTLEILNEYSNLSENATKNQIINTLRLYQDKIRDHREQLFKDINSINHKLSWLAQRGVEYIPEELLNFLEKNNIKYKTGFQYLSEIYMNDSKKSQKLNRDYPYLGFSILVNNTDFNQVKAFTLKSGIDFTLIVNIDHIDNINIEDLHFATEFDFELISNYENKIKQLKQEKSKLEEANIAINQKENKIANQIIKIEDFYISKDDLNISKVNLDTKNKALLKIKNDIKTIKGKIKLANDLEQNINNLKNSIYDIEKMIEGLNKLIKNCEEISYKVTEKAKIEDKIVILNTQLDNLENSIELKSKIINELFKQKIKTNNELEKNTAKVNEFSSGKTYPEVEVDIDNYSAIADEKRLENLINERSSELSYIQEKIEDLKNKLIEVNKASNMLNEEYASDIYSFRDYYDKNEVDRQAKIIIDFSNYNSIYNNYLKLRKKFEDLKVDEKVLRKQAEDKISTLDNFKQKHKENSFNENEHHYTTLADAERNLNYLNSNIQSLSKSIRADENTDIYLDNYIENLKIKGRYEKLQKYYSDHVTSPIVLEENKIKDLISECKELDNDNQELKKQIIKNTISLLNKIDKKTPKFVSKSNIDFSNLKSALKNDVDMLSKIRYTVNVSEEYIQKKNLLARNIINIKESINIELINLNRSIRTIKDLEVQASKAIIRIAQELSDGLKQISKNSRVNLKKFNKSYNLVKINQGKLDGGQDTNRQEQIHANIVEKIKGLYTEYKEQISKSNNTRFNDQTLINFINNNINYTTMYNWVFEGKLANLKFEIYNSESNDKINYLKWNEASTASGAQWFVISLTLLIPILRYLSTDVSKDDALEGMDQQLELDFDVPKYKGTYLLVDNFIANATSESILASVLEFAEKADIQIISLNQASASNIAQKFHNIINLVSDGKSKLAFMSLNKVSTKDVDYIVPEYDNLLINYVDEDLNN